MTLGQMSDYVTRKLHVDDDTDAVTFCKDSIKRWYEEIFNTSLWVESLGYVTATVTASLQDVTLSDNPTLFYYPTASTTTGTKVDLVVATKFVTGTHQDDTELIGGDWISFFQLDPSAWESYRSTTPTGFINLPKDASGNCRIRLVPTPNQAGTLYVLGKLKLTNLSADSDSPVLRGITNTLLLFAEADMLEWNKEYDKARSKRQEAVQLLQNAKDIERGQQQIVTKFVPADHGFYTAEDIA